MGPPYQYQHSNQRYFFNLVYGADAVLPPKIYLETIRVAYFNAKDHAEARELDSNLLEESCNTALANV
jgi:hypothetical protein